MIFAKIKYKIYIFKLFLAIINNLRFDIII